MGIGVRDRRRVLRLIESGLAVWRAGTLLGAVALAACTGGGGEAVTVREYNAAIRALDEPPRDGGVLPDVLRAALAEIAARERPERRAVLAAMRIYRPRYVCAPYSEFELQRDPVFRDAIDQGLANMTPPMQLAVSIDGCPMRPETIRVTNVGPVWVPYPPEWERNNIYGELYSAIRYFYGRDWSRSPAPFLAIGDGDEIDDRVFVDFAGASEGIFHYVVTRNEGGRVVVDHSYCLVRAAGPSEDLFFHALHTCLDGLRRGPCVSECIR